MLLARILQSHVGKSFELVNKLLYPSNSLLFILVQAQEYVQLDSRIYKIRVIQFATYLMRKVDIQKIKDYDILCG
jgi:hypothetical protein